MPGIPVVLLALLLPALSLAAELLMGKRDRVYTKGLNSVGEPSLSSGLEHGAGRSHAGTVFTSVEAGTRIRT